VTTRTPHVADGRVRLADTVPGVNAHRMRQRVIVENDSTVVGCQSALLLSSL
jgi:hypothetical protein